MSIKRNDLLLIIDDYLQEKYNVKKEFIPGKTIVPVSGATITPEDIEAVIDTALDGWFTEHKRCKKFSDLLCEYLKSSYCLLVNSGSSASLVAMTTLAEKTNDRKRFIITTALAFPTTISPIYQNRLIPIFVDVEKENFSPKIDQIKEVLDTTDELAGAIFTHTLGFPYREDIISDLLGNELYLISDGCDSLGATVPHLISEDYVEYFPIGSFSDVLTLSFFPAHHLTTSGEGGAVLFRDKEDYDIARSISNWGRSCYCSPGQDNACGKRFSQGKQGGLPLNYDHKYVFDRLGYNLKMTELQGAMGITQLDKLDTNVRIRKENFLYLLYGLMDVEHLSFIKSIYVGTSSPFGFPIFVNEDAPFSANDLIFYLEDHKIKTRRFFAGNIIKQPGFYQYPRINKDLSNTDYIMYNGFWIGCYPGITNEMMDYVVETIKTFIKNKK